MAITQLNYPVTGSLGSYRNIFPSNRVLNIDFERKDGLISTITSGTDGFARLTLLASYDGSLQVGDFVTWSSDGYTLRTNRVTELFSATAFDVDTPFNSGDATNGFVNYRKQWFLEARFVAKNSTTDQQDAITVTDDYSQIPSARDGSLSLDCSQPSDLLTPDFDPLTVIGFNLFTEFKVQFRESYSTNRSELWESPTPDVPIMLVLGTQKMPFNDFTDGLILQGKFYSGYTYAFTYIYSSINDNGVNDITFTLNQYEINKTLIDSSLYAVLSNFNGLAILDIPAIDILPNTAFIELTAEVTSSEGQYDLTQYDLTQYA